MLRVDQLYPAQKTAAKQLASVKQVALFADPGDGKTITTLTAIRLLQKRDEIDPNKKILIVAPATVCKEKVWLDEIGRWAHTRRLKAVNLQAVKPDERLDALLSPSTLVFTISYSLIPWLVDSLLKDCKPKMRLADLFSVIVFDELSKMKSPSAKTRFGKVRRYIKDVPVRIGLTGSPLGNSYLNLWSEMYTVAGEMPLGPRYTDYKEEFFKPMDRNRHIWKIKDGSASEITRRIKPYCVYIPNARGTSSAARISFKLIKSYVPKKLRTKYDELKNDYVTLIGDDAIYSEQAAVVHNKLRQFESGGIYKNVELGEEASGEWLKLHDIRIDKTKELIDSLQGQQILIGYSYKHELERLKKAIPSAVSIKEKDAVKRWNNGEIPVLLAHPASAGHGLNLHYSGAYNLMFFTTPWSFELIEQFIGRLDRIGQKKIVNVFAFNGTYIADRALANYRHNLKEQKAVKLAVAFPDFNRLVS